MGIEFELKFSAAPEQLAAIREAYPGAWQEMAMDTTYFDTPEGDLAARSFTFRRRLENGIPVFTFKTPAGPQGRGEWEWQGETVDQAVRALTAQGCPPELDVLLRRGFAPVCGARFLRQRRLVKLENCAVELALDQGMLTGGGREEALCEVEVELKSGSPKGVVAFAEQLARQFGLSAGKKSKFRRALALTKGDAHGGI